MSKSRRNTIDPDEIMSTINRNRTDLGLSFLHAVRVIRRKLPAFGAIPPSAQNSFS